MAIITISRMLGSRGTKIANELILGERMLCLDRKLIDERLEGSGLSRKTIERFDERKPGFWDRIYRDAERYKHLLVESILEVASEGNCVILGRGAQVAMAVLPGVLRVRAVASKTTRLKRIQRRLECDEEVALRILRRSDQNRAGFHRYFFEVKWDTPELYDLVLNTDRMSVGSAVELIKKRSERPPYSDAREVTHKRLGDLYLAQRVKTKLFMESMSPVYLLDVSAEDKRVTLQGSLPTQEQVRQAELVALSVPGVEHVVNRVAYMPRPHGIE